MGWRLRRSAAALPAAAFVKASAQLIGLVDERLYAIAGWVWRFGRYERAHENKCTER